MSLKDMENPGVFLLFFNSFIIKFFRCKRDLAHDNLPHDIASVQMGIHSVHPRLMKYGLQISQHVDDTCDIVFFNFPFQHHWTNSLFCGFGPVVVKTIQLYLNLLDYSFRILCAVERLCNPLWKASQPIWKLVHMLR